MTRLTKCDTCRARKVKCDETRPTCRMCTLAGKTCRYREGISFVSSGEGAASQEECTALETRSSRTTDDGEGMFQILKPRKGLKYAKRRAPAQISVEGGILALSRPSNALSSPRTRLVSRWGAVLGENVPHSNSLSVYGSVLFVAPLRIGEDPVLDLAVEYFVHSGEMFRRDQSGTGNPACATGEKAVKGLRRALSTRRADENVMLAILLHAYAEDFISVGTWYYVPHLLALAQLLRARAEKGREEELDYGLVQGAYYDEVTEAILSGRDSLFDGFLPTRPLSITALDLASSLLLENLVKIPRLARLLRECSTATNKASCFPEIIGLAEELYFNDTRSAVEKVLIGVQLAPTQIPDIAQHFRQSYSGFLSIELFSLSVRYHSFRVVLCGLLQTLLSLNIPCPRLNRKLIEKQDIDAADALGMSVDYALTTQQAVPLVSLRMISPLEWSVGSWHRLLKRARDDESKARAITMQNWCIAITDNMKVQWRAPKCPLERLQVKMEAAAGGPMVEGVRRNFDWSSVRIET